MRAASGIDGRNEAEASVAVERHEVGRHVDVERERGIAHDADADAGRRASATCRRNDPGP